MGLHVNTDKTEYMCFNQGDDISTQNGGSLKLVDKFTYLGSSISSTKNTRLAIKWNPIFPSSGRVKTTIWMHHMDTDKTHGKKLDGSCAIMLRDILNKCWRQHPIKQQLYGQLPPISKTIQIRRTRLTEHCWRSKDELISDVLLWSPSLGQASVGRPARNYLQKLCTNTLCKLENLPVPMDDRDEMRERVKETRASGMTR